MDSATKEFKEKIEAALALLNEASRMALSDKICRNTSPYCRSQLSEAREAAEFALLNV